MPLDVISQSVEVSFNCFLCRAGGMLGHICCNELPCSCFPWTRVADYTACKKRMGGVEMGGFSVSSVLVAVQTLISKSVFGGLWIKPSYLQEVCLY